MRQYLSGIAGFPFYANMYAASGYPFAAAGTPPDALVDQLVISGDEAAIKAGLTDLLDRGIDELVLTLMPGPDRESGETRLIALIGGL
jgi:hypothetical protein